MNVYDSDQIEATLKPMGYQRTDTIGSADLIIVNTCSIRAKAEQKAFSFLGRLSELKLKNPNLIIAVGGCLAQQENQKILKRMPHVDLVFGTHAVDRLPQMVAQFQEDSRKIVDIDQSDDISVHDSIPIEIPSGKISTYVTIMRGCDNYCTYCVVPYVRGRESSRSPRDIIKEIENLTFKGIKEITLLGQNVNSYGRKELLITFPQLLALINDIDKLERIRFTTSHPKDLGTDLMQAFATLSKLCHHIHLPIQSGSNSVLKRMNRKYTRQLYLEKVSQLRTHCPEIAITSDIIVGFPGERDTDFQKTVDLIEQVRFQSLFAFKYSDRPLAPSNHFSGQVPEKIKDERLQTILNLQNHITRDKHHGLVGTTQRVLVEGPSKRSDEGEEIQLNRQAKEHIIQSQWTGRTSTNLIVNFQVPKTSFPIEMNLSGHMVDVIIEKAMAHSISGRILDGGPLEDGLKGDNWYAA